MTNMIYRGVKHNGQRSIEACTAKELIYRGVAHDGGSFAPNARPLRAEMCYRGVRYSVQPDGAIAAADPIVAPSSSRAAAMQVA